MRNYSADQIRNVAVLGHSGCGKTTIVEACLHVSGGSKRFGRIEEGNTVSDYDPEEIKRKVSISSSIIPVEWLDEKINFIDTPGYFDFVGEVKEALAVADLALIVVDGKAGVQVGTEKAWEMATEANLPKMIIVNGMDDENANWSEVCEALKQTFGKSIAPIQVPFYEDGKYVGFVNAIRRKARKFENGLVEPCDMPAGMEDEVETIRNMIEEAVAETDDELMEKFFAEESFTEDEIHKGINIGIVDGSVTPVVSSSAITTLGIRVLMNSINKFLPPTNKVRPTMEAINPKTDDFVEINCDENEPASAFVFKTISDPYVGRLSVFKVCSGVIKKDTMLKNVNKNIAEKIGKVYIVRGKEQIEIDRLNAGDIGAVAKLQNTSTNDTLASPDRPVQMTAIDFPTPYLSKGIKPKTKGDEDKLAGAVAKMLEEDKTLDFKVDKETKQSIITGVGESHIDVFVNKLKNRYKIEVELAEPIIPHREMIKSKEQIRYKHKKQSGGGGQYGDVEIIFEPSGDMTTPYIFEEQIFGGAVPKQYFPAVEKGLQECVKAGPLAGYPVVGIKATLVDGSYHPVDSNEVSFKMAAIGAFKEAFKKAKSAIMEPINTVEVVVPDSYTGDVVGDLNKRRGRILGMESKYGKQHITAEVPAYEMLKYATDLRSMTQGRGDFTMEFARFEEAPHDVQEKVIAKRNSATEGK